MRSGRFAGALFGGNVPREFAVPTAPQAGLNNRTARSHTLSPAEKKQEVTDLKLCLPPLRPSFA